ncbi:thioredoxin family protein [Planctobacterium marinum]|uniref:thioredoxin family protein n=1 Tax=Planctobacterium marinum TaxID=1631968 RepID=UPI001E35453A|nr:thioredoxin domain-containing protein [Planctobacterium marinum]MCC2606517.1 thioredoxin fold domain-containing protein [Planctobacterium marinum]
MQTNALELLSNGHGYPEPLLMLWFSAEWCGPCRQLEPVISMLSQTFAGAVRVVKVDADREQALSQRFGVRAIPTLVLLSHDQTLGTQVGLSSYLEISQWLESNLTPAI